jgi:hypothetical protein
MEIPGFRCRPDDGQAAVNPGQVPVAGPKTVGRDPGNLHLDSFQTPWLSKFRQLVGQITYFATVGVKVLFGNAPVAVHIIILIGFSRTLLIK